MARVRFIADFDYRPIKAVMIAYRSGMELTVKRDCARQAIAAGKAVSMDHEAPKSTPTDEE